MRSIKTETTIDVKLRRIEESGSTPHYMFVFGEYNTEERIGISTWQPGEMTDVFIKHAKFDKEDEE